MRFDIQNFICHICGFTGTADRVQCMLNELKRIGARGTVHWSFPNPFDKVLLKQFKHSKMFDDNIGFFNASRNHYRIIKTAYELGREWVWVCEDDCRFMKDVQAVQKAMSMYPDDADVLLFDGIPASKHDADLIAKFKATTKDGWMLVSSMRSAACYALNKKAMKQIIWLYESVVNKKVHNATARLCDQWFEDKMLAGCKMYMACPNIAVQQTIDGSHNTGSGWRLRGYEMLGINIEDYAK